MNERCLRFIALVLMVGGVVVMEARAADRPNIVFIYTDDQADWSVGAYGNRQASTPHLDQLAREGARFTNAMVTTPVCSPSRAGFMTSRFSSELGILDFITPREHRAYTPAIGDVGLRREDVTIPEILRGRGYDTALFGKWHLGDWRADAGADYHPSRHGYSFFLGFVGGAGPANPVTVGPQGETRQWTGLTDDILTNEAITYITARREAPFFVQLNLRSPHAPWRPVAPADEEPFLHLDPEIPNPDYPDLDVADVKRRMREYLASVAGVDRNVGRLVDTLRKAGLENNTVVIFTSDHGFNVGHNGIWHKGNGIWATRNVPADSPERFGRYRPNLYDHSLRVPLIVRWPGVVPPGIVIDDTASNLDWLPTLAGIAGGNVPQTAIVRGRSLLSLLRGERVVEWEQDFYAEYSMRVYAQVDLRMYRTPDWKLVRDFRNAGRDELYQLSQDPEERVNLIHDPRPEVQDKRLELQARILERMKQLDDPLLKTSADRPADGVPLESTLPREHASSVF